MAKAEEVKKVKKDVKEAAETTDTKTEEAEKTPEQILKERKHEVKETAEEPKENKGPKVKAKTVKPKVVQKRRSRLERRGKKYQEAAKLVDRTKQYSLDEAVALLPELSTTKFDASVEAHVNLGIDTKQSDQLVRGMLTLPHGSGKSQRVAVLADSSGQSAAKKAGADKVGEQDLMDAIEKGKLDFDVLVTTSAFMPKLGKLAKVLGPKGLMPNPKSGTVTTDIEKTVKELKAGRAEFRADSGGIIHQIVGKVSFKPEQLSENIKALIKAIEQAKPDSVKLVYIQKVSLTTSMGPSLRLDLKSLA